MFRLAGHHQASASGWPVPRRNAWPAPRRPPSAVAHPDREDQEGHEQRVRVEVVLILAFWIALFVLLDLSWQHVLIMYACFAFNWSTRQYITHAFTERHVINGALNLRVSPAMSWILLKGNWDLVHHQKPWLPWTELERNGNGAYSPVGIWQQYLRMWCGPVPATSPSPQRLKAEPRPD